MWGMCVCVCVCTYILWNVSHQKEQNNVICSHMDGPKDCHTESGKGKYHIIPFTCRI